MSVLSCDYLIILYQSSWILKEFFIYFQLIESETNQRGNESVSHNGRVSLSLKLLEIKFDLEREKHSKIKTICSTNVN
jgi:hypothetical protein